MRGTLGDNGQVRSIQSPAALAGRDVSLVFQPRQPVPGAASVGSHIALVIRARCVPQQITPSTLEEVPAKRPPIGIAFAAIMYGIKAFPSGRLREDQREDECGGAAEHEAAKRLLERDPTRSQELVSRIPEGGDG
jgi:hypothetical protein